MPLGASVPFVLPIITVGHYTRAILGAGKPNHRLPQGGNDPGACPAHFLPVMVQKSNTFPLLIPLCPVEDGAVIHRLKGG